MTIRPKTRLGSESAGLGSGRPYWARIDWVSFVSSGPGGRLVLRASMVWFWIRSARSRRQERLTMRLANIVSIGPTGANSSSISSR